MMTEKSFCAVVPNDGDRPAGMPDTVMGDVALRKCLEVRSFVRRGIPLEVALDWVVLRECDYRNVAGRKVRWIPTPDEIRERVAEIRKGWDRQARADRGEPKPGPVYPAMISLDEVSGEVVI